MDWLLIIISIIVAGVDWFGDKPKRGEPIWPRWIKLGCAIGVAWIGIAGVVAGFFAREEGVEAYQNRNLLQALKKLNVAYASPFKNREVIDFLGLTHKAIADQAIDEQVAAISYQKSLDFFIESRIAYPESPYAKNNMINVYRRQKDWIRLTPLLGSFENEIRMNHLKNDDGSNLTSNQRATLLVTLGNVFADQDNPRRSDKRAVELYEQALEYNSKNLFAILNLPPRLIDIAEQLPYDSERRQTYLRKALMLSYEGLNLEEERDRVFAALSIIQIDLMKNRPKVNENNFSIALSIILQAKKSDVDFDIDTWFILAEAYLKNNDFAQAENAFYEASIYQARFTNAHHDLAESLWAKLGKSEEYPFKYYRDFNSK